MPYFLDLSELTQSSDLYFLSKQPNIKKNVTFFSLRSFFSLWLLVHSVSVPEPEHGQLSLRLLNPEGVLTNNLKFKLQRGTENLFL